MTPVQVVEGIVDGFPVNVSGAFAVSIAQPSAAVVSSVVAAVVSVTLLAANAARKGAIIFNDSTADLFLKLGATASSASFTIKLLNGQSFTLPFPAYTGVIDGIWGAAVGNARITELT